MPWEFIKIIRMGSGNKKLRPKANGNLGKKRQNDKGVYRGSPLIAPVYLIYFDNMLQMYDASKQERESNKVIQERAIKNDESENA